ncbi:DUF1294 domain-containing protein [Paenisporosarcina quisquiliarum]|uniref:DUF1294 domain-containing protein n=1 Tax=Paenisporosarcina quisquiliarum TaxID=365346 RepID=A0A9X3LH02_9BACL|nr:DUF1294 domain-containing protein [Paenisporosarcina quisquiliarum]MCZ8536244.1 DUF1294 domain-containing protein [Paenisporosarcina quisquiliarum]
MYFIIIGLFIVMSIVAFFTMGHDKSAAQTRNRRVPERTLWNLALFGGGVGAYLGMILYRHKTKHMSFRIGFTLLAILQVALLIWAAQFLKEWS